MPSFLARLPLTRRCTVAGSFKESFRSIIRRNRDKHQLWRLSACCEQNMVILSAVKNWYCPTSHGCNKRWVQRNREGWHGVERVQCEACLRWRRLPTGVDSWPREFYCQYNGWDRRYASCTAVEEEWKRELPLNGDRVLCLVAAAQWCEGTVHRVPSEVQWARHRQLEAPLARGTVSAQASEGAAHPCGAAGANAGVAGSLVPADPADPPLRSKRARRPPELFKAESCTALSRALRAPTKEADAVRKSFRVVEFPSAAGAGRGDEGGQGEYVAGGVGSRVRAAPLSLCLQLSAEARGKTWLFVHEWETLQPRGHQLSHHVGERAAGEPDGVELGWQQGDPAGNAQLVGKDDGKDDAGAGGPGGGEELQRAEAISGGGMGEEALQAREKGGNRLVVKKVTGADAAARNDGGCRGLGSGAPAKNGIKRARAPEGKPEVKEEAVAQAGHMTIRVVMKPSAADAIQVSEEGLEAEATCDQVAVKSSPPADAAVPPPPPSVGATFLFKFDGAHWSPVRLLRQAGCRNPKEWLAIRAEIETRISCAAAGDTSDAGGTPVGDAAATAAAAAAAAAEVENLVGARPRRAAPVKRYDTSISSAELSRRKREEARRDEERRKRYWWVECLDSPVATSIGLAGRHVMLELAADTWGELWITTPRKPRLPGPTTC
jgi:hypothetical protein